MKQRLKGLLALVLSLVMVFALATNAWAATATSVEIGSSVTLDSTKPYWKNGDTTATASANDYNAYFDAATYTLTLNGANIGNTYYGYGISANGDLTINLIGDNTVTHNDSGGIAAIHVDGDLTIKEGRDDGSLTASDTGTNSDGILASGEVTIESGNVTATGGKYGLSASNVNIKGGTVTATGDEDCGIYTKEGNVTISGGTVEATGRDSGINANNITISGGTVTAGSATDDGSGSVTYNSTFGIKADSSISITGGTVTATGFDAIAINENTTTTTGTISISGATTTVTANGGNSGIYAKGSVTINGGSVEAYATDDSDGIGIYAPGGEIAISGDNTQVTVGCATGLEASVVNILENSTVKINAALTAIDSTTLNMGSDPWYQWSTNNPGETTPVSSATKAFALNNYGGTGQNPVPTSLTIEKISTGGTGTTNPTPPSIYYPIAPTTPEPEGDKVTTPDTFDGGIASAVVVTILSATGGAWLAKKKD